MPKLAELTDVIVHESLLGRTPPIELLTRVHFLIGGDAAEVFWLDATVETGKEVPGARYAFTVVADDALCHLVAEHDDEYWSYDETKGRPTPMRRCDAWRRPLRSVTAVGLGGALHEWIPDRDFNGAQFPILRLIFADGTSVDAPFPRMPSRAKAPDAKKLLDMVTASWAESV